MTRKFGFEYRHYDSLDSLPDQESMLVDKAREACDGSHAPYSKFNVGAAALLESGRVVVGANQESEVFPAGICAERSLLFHHQATAADDRIVALAIASQPAQRECYPCGICRQVINDVQKRQKSKIKVIMTSDSSATVVDDAADLLPFLFEL